MLQERAHDKNICHLNETNDKITCTEIRSYQQLEQAPSQDGCLSHKASSNCLDPA